MMEQNAYVATEEQGQKGRGEGTAVPCKAMYPVTQRPPTNSYHLQRAMPGNQVISLWGTKLLAGCQGRLNLEEKGFQKEVS